MKRIHIFLIIVLALALVGWFLLWPSIQGAIQGRIDLVFWQQKLSEAKDSKQKLNELEAKLPSLQNEESRILEAVPASGDIPGLLVQMEALASQNGLILNSLNFVYPETGNGVRAALMETDTSGGSSAVAPAGTSGASLPSSVSALSVSLDLNGNYSSLKNFLIAMENNLRLTDVNTVNFSQGAGDTIGYGKLNVGVNVYYKQ